MHVKQIAMNMNVNLENLGVSELNEMQQQMIEAFPKHRNLILLSPTGSGKTLAFLLPLIEALQSNSRDVQAVILVPSRELALQIEQVFKKIASGFTIMSCYGGRPAMDEHRVMKQLHPQVIVGTPGRMNDHLGKENFDASTVKMLIIDEFDKCLEFGFHDVMMEIVQHLSAIRKRILISATDAEELPMFAGAEGAFRLNFLTENKVSDRLTLYRVNSPVKDKLETLYRLICHLKGESTLVFCNHRESVERIFQYLKGQKVVCEVFHGGMEQDKRERALYKFQNESCSVLVATDLAARGLDIAHVAHVIHYHLPINEEGFVHRNGRTARWDAGGAAYVILRDEETIPDFLPEQMSEYAFFAENPKLRKPKFVTLYIGKGKKDKINKIDIVGFLSKKGQLGKDEIGRIDVKEHYAYAAIKREKLKQVLNVIQNEKIKGVKTLIEAAK